MSHGEITKMIAAPVIATLIAVAGCDARDTGFGEGKSSCVPPYGGTLVDGEVGAGYAPCSAPDGSTVMVPPGGGWGIWICGTCGEATYSSVICLDGKLACIAGSSAGARREVVSFCEFTYGAGDCVATAQSSSVWEGAR